MNISKKTNILAINALFCGITIILGFTPLGMIPTPIISPTTVHIPAIIATLLLGLKSGLIVSACFGMVSFLHALQAPVFITAIFLNPLIAIFPRLFIAIVAHYSFKIFSKIFFKEYISIIISSVLASLANTVFTLGSILFIYSEKINKIILDAVNSGKISESFSGNASGYILNMIGIPYGICEALVAALVVPAIVIAIKKSMRG